MGSSAATALLAFQSSLWVALAIVLSACAIAAPGLVTTWLQRRRRRRRAQRLGG